MHYNSLHEQHIFFSLPFLENDEDAFTFQFLTKEVHIFFNFSKFWSTHCTNRGNWN